MSQPIILTDLDNTVYNWVDFFGPSFRAMVHALAKELPFSEDYIIQDFKNLYAKHSSVEYPFAIQELEMCKGMPPTKVERLVRYGRAAFSMSRKKNLKPYDDVKETLQWATRAGILVVGVTNSPLYQAEMRLRQLNLDPLFTGLAGWDTHEIPKDDYPWLNEIRRKAENGHYKSEIKRKWALSTEELKPSPMGYLRILDDLHISHKETYVIGDSLHKDVGPAVEIGANGILATYGQEYNPKNFETLLKITHWSKDKITAVYNDQSVEPTFTVNSFSELKRIVQPYQLVFEELFA
jgi:FMN phosphatase YigB (HAD superfamily)